MFSLLQSHDFSHVTKNKHFHNLQPQEFLDHALKLGHGALTSDGALYVNSGALTGRAANDKYVVTDEGTLEKVWWGPDVKKMTPRTFDEIKKEVIHHLQNCEQIYTLEKGAGADPKFHMKVQLITSHPSYGLFAQYLFRPLLPLAPLGEYTIWHAPTYFADSQKHQLRSSTVIATNFTERSIIILGTSYAGEIKKSIFSVLNYILPDHHILPMHSGANLGQDGKASVFFGLSGTGKTTLSTDEGKKLIGDDEHGLSEQGIFNFEGGCYAKTFQLNFDSEPDIYKACTRSGALLENVVVNSTTKKVDFNDISLSENGRGSYPLNFISHIVESSLGPVPQDLFFLSADAFGVLPPVAKLSKAQAMYYFLSGYTAKVAGTEVGIKEPEATFSTCFGGPFMLRNPNVYGGLLGEYLEKLNINVWLINTGWTQGPYGVGKRFPIKVTRSIIRAIQANQVNTKDWAEDPIFGLKIPTQIEGVDSSMLLPWKTWSNAQAYTDTAQKLALMFHKNMQRFTDLSSEILKGRPLYH